MRSMNLGPETEILEHKRTTGEQKAAADSLAAMLNKHGHGVLFFGVKDDGTVMGQQVTAKTLREVAQTIRDRISPTVYPQVERMTYYDRECIRVEVNGDDAPYSSAGVYLTRIGDEDVRMTREHLEGVLHRRHRKLHPWDEEPSERTVADVDEGELRRYVERGQEAGRISFDFDSSRNVLERLGLLDGEVLRNAAAVAFCPSSLPRIQMAVFAGSTRQLFLDNQRYAGTLFELVRQGEFYIANHLMRRFEFVDGQMHRNEIPEIPFKATREILYNALCHRDYERPENVQIDIFGDRVEVFSPGALPEDMDVEAHISGQRIYSRSRNALLANTLYRSGDIETYGSGLPRVKRLCDEAGIGVQVEQVYQGTVAVIERPDWQREFADAVETGVIVDNDNVDNVKNKTAAQAHTSHLFSQSNVKIKTESEDREGLTQTERRICLYLSTHPTATQLEVAEHLSIGKSSVANHISRLQRKGYLRREGSRRIGAWVVVNPKELGL